MTRELEARANCFLNSVKSPYHLLEVINNNPILSPYLSSEVMWADYLRTYFPDCTAGENYKATFIEKSEQLYQSIEDNLENDGRIQELIVPPHNNDPYFMTRVIMIAPHLIRYASSNLSDSKLLTRQPKVISTNKEAWLLTALHTSGSGRTVFLVDEPTEENLSTESEEIFHRL